MLSIEARQFTVGRGEGCDYVITHSTVSRVHLKIIYSEHEVLLEDLNSKTGTFVFHNGAFKKIKNAKINKNTVIRIGDTLPEMEVDDLIKNFEMIHEKERNKLSNKIKEVGVKRCSDCGGVTPKNKIHCNTCGAILES